MNKVAHRIYLGTMTAIVIAVTLYLIYYGNSYYSTSIEERFYHVNHKMLKPSGPLGHGFGIVGTIMMLVGVFGYQARKYLKSWARLGVLKHWLEFHIFLCVLGPILVLFHTSFKFGGLVSISFWSMMAVVFSGVIGRFIYLQIPRTIQGRELSLSEIHELKGNLTEKIKLEMDFEGMDEILASTSREKREGNLMVQYIADWKYKSKIRRQLIDSGIRDKKLQGVMQLVSHELTITRRIERLQVMLKLFKYWHVIHLPFAIVMLVIMVIHVAVTLALGYRWIF